MARLVAALVVLAALCAPAGAQAAFFHGETARGFTVTLTSDVAGSRVLHATVGWRARCDGRIVVASFGGILRPERATAGPGEFSAVLTDAVDPDEGLTGRYEAAITGRRHVKRGRPGGEQWSGTFEASIVLSRDEEVVSRCRVPRQRWRAWREGLGTGRWTMASDQGDYIGGGFSYAYDDRNATISAIGDRKHVTFGVEARDGAYWTADFAAPPGQRLRSGTRYAGTLRYPFNDDAPGLDVGGQHRGCNTSRGEFTVTRARYDRRGRMRAFTASFVQHCESGAPALRGTVSFTRARR